MITVKFTRVPGTAREFCLDDSSDVDSLLSEGDVELEHDEVVLVNGAERDCDWLLHEGDEVMVTKLPKFESVSAASMSDLLHQLNTNYRSYRAVGFVFGAGGYTVLLEADQTIESE